MEHRIIYQRKKILPLWVTLSCYFLKVKFGGGIVAASGSVAGNTYSRNRFGPYIRARTSPVNPNTERQQLVRASVAFCAAFWANTLTAVQRAAWDLYGSSVAMTDKLGATMYLTGYNQFMRSNVIFKMVGGTPIAAGPTVFEIPAHDPTFAVTVSEAGQQLTFSFDVTMDWAVETGGILYLFQGKPQNAQRNYFGSPWRHVGNVGGIDPGGPVSPAPYAVDFAVAEGQHQWAYARIGRADGRLSEPFRADTFCAV